jgi:hypothetical protein
MPTLEEDGKYSRVAEHMQVPVPISL